MRKFCGYILTPIHYLSFVVLLCIFHPIQWICFNWFGYSAHKRSVDILNFFLTYTLWVMGSKVTFINEQQLPVNRPIIFLANHQSSHDIPALIWFLRKYHAKFISKIELTKGIPSVSYNLRHGGGANIDRKDSRQSLMELAKLGTRMRENNWSAVIFPEGTRSKDGKMKMFQGGGIGAILKKCPNALLVPVAISNYYQMLKWGYYPLGAFVPIKWEVLEPIEPGDSSPNDLATLAENKIRARVGQTIETDI